jgi:hypothetical protein
VNLANPHESMLPAALQLRPVFGLTRGLVAEAEARHELAEMLARHHADAHRLRTERRASYVAAR